VLRYQLISGGLDRVKRFDWRAGAKKILDILK